MTSESETVCNKVFLGGFGCGRFLFGLGMIAIGYLLLGLFRGV